MHDAVCTDHFLGQAFPGSHSRSRLSIMDRLGLLELSRPDCNSYPVTVSENSRTYLDSTLGMRSLCDCLHTSKEHHH
jgi:hypothetical protein